MIRRLRADMFQGTCISGGSLCLAALGVLGAGDVVVLEVGLFGIMLVSRSLDDPAVVDVPSSEGWLWWIISIPYLIF